MTTIKHVAIIMDGNGRWAKKQQMIRTFGHLSGSENVRNISIRASDLGLEALTLYAFSTENWKRPVEEVNYLMKLPKVFFDKYMQELMSKNIRVSTIGDLEAFPQETRDVLHWAINRSKNNTGMVLNFAMNYGSRDEIVRAVNEIHKYKLINPDFEITEASFEKFLMTKDLPEVDLMIRTSGEQRLSNFLLYQLAYSELMFVEESWPEFTCEIFEQCLEAYKLRHRRFGGI
jgi:undecaprenyl diphosphate synthase